MTTIATVLSNPRVFMHYDGEEKTGGWHVEFDVNQSGWDGVRLSSGGMLLDLPTTFSLRAGAAPDPSKYMRDARKPDERAVGLVHHWPASNGDHPKRGAVIIECAIPETQVMRVIESIERGRPPIAASFRLPNIGDGWGGGWQWEVSDENTWREITSFGFSFDRAPEPEAYIDPDLGPERVPIPIDQLIASGLGWLRLDLAKYAMIGGGLLVALILAVLWRG